MRAPRRLRALATAVAPTLLASLALATLPACATSTAGGGGGAPAALALESAPVPERGPVLERAPAQPDVSLREVKGTALTRDPMRPLADVLQSLWPTVTRPDPRRIRPLGADSDVGVYAGSAYIGDWEWLRTVRSGEVARVQRLSTAEAFQRFGRSHSNGALVVTFWPGGAR